MTFAILWLIFSFFFQYKLLIVWYAGRSAKGNMLCTMFDYSWPWTFNSKLIKWFLINGEIQVWHSEVVSISMIFSYTCVYYDKLLLQCMISSFTGYSFASRSVESVQIFHSKTLHEGGLSSNTELDSRKTLHEVYLETIRSEVSNLVKKKTT